MHLTLLLSLALASAPAARFVPDRARPGDLFTLEVRGCGDEPSAEVAARRLRFFPAGKGRWRAFGGLPIETAPGPLAVAVARGSCAPAVAALEVVDPGFREKTLAVEPQFTAERPPEVQARVDADRAAFLAAFERPFEAPLFTRAFALPRRAAITGRYGDRRTFNGATQGQHYGLDLKGRTGDPVHAANRGRVTLVRDAWASGLSVVVDHGAGLHSVYFHLSRVDVKEGQRVERGQRIGAVGATGRSSGPHLHWGMRVGDLYVDPESVLRLRP